MGLFFGGMLKFQVSSILLGNMPDFFFFWGGGGGGGGWGWRRSS